MGSGRDQPTTNAPGADVNGASSTGTRTRPTQRPTLNNQRHRHDGTRQTTYNHVPSVDVDTGGSRARTRAPQRSTEDRSLHGLLNGKHKTANTHVPSVDGDTGGSRAQTRAQQRPTEGRSHVAPCDGRSIDSDSEILEPVPTPAAHITHTFEHKRENTHTETQPGEAPIPANPLRGIRHRAQDYFGQGVGSLRHDSPVTATEASPMVMTDYYPDCATVCPTTARMEGERRPASQPLRGFLLPTTMEHNTSEHEHNHVDCPAVPGAKANRTFPRQASTQPANNTHQHLSATNTHNGETLPMPVHHNQTQTPVPVGRALVAFIGGSEESSIAPQRTQPTAWTTATQTNILHPRRSPRPHPPPTMAPSALHGAGAHDRTLGPTALLPSQPPSSPTF